MSRRTDLVDESRYEQNADHRLEARHPPHTLPIKPLDRLIQQLLADPRPPPSPVREVFSVPESSDDSYPRRSRAEDGGRVAPYGGEGEADPDHALRKDGELGDAPAGLVEALADFVGGLPGHDRKAGRRTAISPRVESRA